MNDEVRAAVSARLAEQHLSRADLARAIGRTPQVIPRALNGTQDGGTLPPTWKAILDALGPTLTALPPEQARRDSAAQLFGAASAREQRP